MLATQCRAKATGATFAVTYAIWQAQTQRSAVKACADVADHASDSTTATSTKVLKFSNFSKGPDGSTSLPETDVRTPALAASQPAHAHSKPWTLLLEQASASCSNFPEH